MRQLKFLVFAALALVFVAGVGVGAFARSLSAATNQPSEFDRRVQDFEAVFSLTPTQERQLREILAENDARKEGIRQPTPEQFRQLRAVEAESRERIRAILTEEQRTEWDRRTAPR